MGTTGMTQTTTQKKVEGHFGTGTGITFTDAQIEATVPQVKAQVESVQKQVGGLADAAGLMTPNPDTAAAAYTLAAQHGYAYNPFTDVNGNAIAQAQYVEHITNLAISKNPTTTNISSTGVTMYQIPGTDIYVTKAAYAAYLSRVNG